MTISSRFTPNTAMAVVVANMIGTGVFTSLGYQLLDIQSVFPLMLLWLVGGLAALCGALSYAELCARLPRSGGEYHFLRETYHPAAGFISGWVSATVGFAAPTALAAMTFAGYLSSAVSSVITLHEKALAVGLVLVLTLTHSFSRETSSRFQTIFTLIKVVLIVIFCFAVYFSVDTPQSLNFLPVSGDWELISGGAFAVSLIYVNYAYTGWNAVTYITNEIEEPQKNIPRVMLLGTLLVMVLYLVLNAIFLYAAPMADMAGQLDIGVIVAQASFGPSGAMLMGITLSLLLISTVSAMVMAGPRVLQVVGEDFRLFEWLATTNVKGVPARAINMQAVITIIFIVTSSFESVLIFSGFIMGFNTLIAVLGVFVLRFRSSDEENKKVSYLTWGYPVTPLIYIGIMLWTLFFIVKNRPEEAAVGLFVIASGLIFYWLSRFLGSYKR